MCLKYLSLQTLRLSLFGTSWSYLVSGCYEQHQWQTRRPTVRKCSIVLNFTKLCKWNYEKKKKRKKKERNGKQMNKFLVPSLYSGKTGQSWSGYPWMKTKSTRISLSYDKNVCTHNVNCIMTNTNRFCNFYKIVVLPGQGSLTSYCGTCR